MIKFHTVSVKNFVSVGDKPIVIHLDRHSATLVQGRNGSGKSSLLMESMSFGLFGKAFRNINKSQLINSFNKKDCLVEIEFTIGSKKYLVRRGMKPELFEIYEDGSLLKAEGKYDYQAHLEKRILRMNHKSFCQIVIIGTATFVPFMQLTQGARREIIEDLLDLQVFSQMNNLLKRRVSDNKDKLSDTKYQIDLLEEKIDLHKKYISNLKSKARKDTVELSNKIDDAKRQVEEYKIRIADQNEKISELRATIQDEDKIKKRLSQYKDAKSKLKEKLGKLKKEIDFYSDNDHCPTCKQGIDENFKCETVDKKNKRIVEIEAALVQLECELETNQSRLDEINEIWAKINEHNKEISNATNSELVLVKYIREISKEIDNTNIGFTESEEQAKLDQLIVDKSLYVDNKEQLLQDKLILDVASVLLKDGGIKAKIIKQYIPIINAAVNKYLQVLDLNVQFEIDENFKETVRSRFREEYSYASFSEGEKRRIDLALTFAWRHIAAMRNSSSTNLLILDEVADGGVDSEGIDDLVKILNTMNDIHIFVISHRESMGDKFENVLKFERVKNFTRIVEND